MINAFGIYTDPLRFRHSLPARATAPFREAIRRSISSLASTDRVAQLASDRWWRVLGQPFTGERTLIRDLRRVLRESGVDSGTLRSGLIRRAEVIAHQVAPFLLDGLVVDWGCGDGLTAAGLLSKKNSVVLVDVSDQRRVLHKRKFLLYDERHPIALRKDRARVVLLLTVLHHAQHPGLTLRHVTELGPERIILIESVPELEHVSLKFLTNPSMRQQVRYEYCGFVDWFYNRVFHENVQVTYNYLTCAGWTQMFEAVGFKLVEQQVLGIDQGLVPEWHVLQIYERANAFTRVT